MMFPVLVLPPEPVEDGWMLTGKATSAAEVEEEEEDEECSPGAPVVGPVPPPPPPAPELVGGVAKGNSPMKLENMGGRLLKTLGVARERMGVVRDSLLVLGCVVVVLCCGWLLAKWGRGDVACYRDERKHVMH